MTKFHILFKQSIRAIFSNKGRSALTMLGIVIGIASVIALISLGEGANRMITKEIQALGATNLSIMPGSGFGPPTNGENAGERNSGQEMNPGSASSLTVNDLQVLKDKSANPEIKTVSGVINSSSIIKYEGNAQRAGIYGVSTEYFEMINLELESGRLLAEEDLDIAVLGGTVAEDLFGESDAIGKTVNINQKDFIIAGVLKKTEPNRFNNTNIQVFIPLTSASTLFGVDNLSLIFVQVAGEDQIDLAKASIEKTLLANHGINDPNLADFSVVSSEDLLSVINQITGILTSVLAGIAGISLVVGGIGIMNIMLVAVTERTREIGLRKAVGAKTSDIMIQFLIEAVLLTLLGGIFGILLGYGMAQVVARLIDLTPATTLNSILLAVGVSSAIGIIFGMYPAAKAAKLNPIDALRYE